MYQFDKEISRMGTDSIKWEKQNSFGVTKGLLPFWIADTDFASVPEILSVIKTRCDHPMIGYSEESESCRQAVCDWFKRRYDWEFTPEEMTLSGGVVTSLYFSLLALTEPKDQVLVFTPVYDPFFAAVNNTDRQLVKFSLTREENEYTIDFARLEETLQKGVKAVILCSPHNPVGRVWTKKELETLAALCSQYQVYILSDEIHCDITCSGHNFVSMAQIPEAREWTLVYNAISKTFNMAGLSSSAIVSHSPTLLKKVRESMDRAWIFGPNALAYSAIEAAYTHGDVWVDEQNAYLEQNRNYVNDYFEKHLPEVNVTPMEGTFLMWLDFGCMNMTSGDMTKTLATDYGIAIGNGQSYGDEDAAGFLRLNIGCSLSLLEKGVKQLHSFYDSVL